jgi:hypothetical protein
VDEVAFGRYRLIAAIVVVIGAILVAAGIAGYLLQPHPPASQTPTVLPAQPSGPTVQSAPASAPTAQPSAAADVPGLAPFVGSWHAHEEGLDIQPNGTVARRMPTNRPVPMHRRLAAARQAPWTSR